MEFGAERTLNLRDAFVTGADATFRTDSWLRQRHALSREPVLIVTGRGNGSAEGIPVIKESVIAVLHKLRRKGVVASWREHTAGALVVDLGSMNDMLTAPRRHRDSRREKAQSDSSRPKETFFGLEGETVALLRRLAEKTIFDLGVQDGGDLIESEMVEKLSVLVRGLPVDGDRESALRAVIIRAIEELDAR